MDGMLQQPGFNAAERPPPALPDLPEEIWLHIASLLSTREWAGASGACRALQRLQPELVDIATTSAQEYSSALKWLRRRIVSAKSVALSRGIFGWHVAGIREYFNQEFQEPFYPAVLPCLAVFRARVKGPLNVKAYSDLYRNVPREVMSILKQAVKLSMLELVCCSIPLLPNMASLKHLALFVEKSHMLSGCLSPVLQALPSLQTLQLSQSHLDQCFSHTGPRGTLIVPVSVQRLELSNFFPKSLELLSGGTVVLMSGGICCMRHALLRWATVRHQIRGLCLYDGLFGEDPSDTESFTEAFPDMLGSIEVLQSVSVLHRDLRWLTNPSMANLTALHVKDTCFSVIIPARSAVRDIRIECRYVLCIRFEDAAVTARHVDVFQATFKHTCEADSLIDFSRDMQDSGKEIMVEVFDDGGEEDEEDRDEEERVKRQKVYYLCYEQPGIMEGWAGLINGCGCEGCVSGSGRFPEASTMFGGVSKVECDYLHYHYDSVGIDLGLLKETLDMHYVACLHPEY